jgi:hypothetical protein
MILSKKELAAKTGPRLECPARGAMHRGTADPSLVIEKCRPVWLKLQAPVLRLGIGV